MGGLVVASQTASGPPPCPICLTRGTLIATPAGSLAVEDLREGMAVWTADPSSSLADLVRDSLSQPTGGSLGPGWSGAVMNSSDNPVPERVTALLGEWKRRLIDLTRRNRLLFFRPLRSASVRIEAPRLVEVFERLVIDEKAWRFYLPRSESAEETQLALIDGESGEAADGPPDVVERLALRPRAEDELMLAGRDEKPLISSLKNLFRRSRTDYEERGVRILYLAFGMLRWRETPQSEEMRMAM